MSLCHKNCRSKNLDLVENSQKSSLTPENESSVKKYSINDAIKETGNKHVEINSLQKSHICEKHSFEGQGKFHLFLLLTCGFTLMAANVETLKMALAMPYIICEMKLSNTERLILSIVGYFGVLSTASMFGYISDHKGRKRVLQVCLLGTFVFASLSAFSSNVLSLIVFRLCIGIL